LVHILIIERSSLASLARRRIASPDRSSTPLLEHFANSEFLLSQFFTLYENGQYSVAYAAGVKFVKVALLQTPKTGHFKSKKHALNTLPKNHAQIREWMFENMFPHMSSNNQSG